MGRWYDGGGMWLLEVICRGSVVVLGVRCWCGNAILMSLWIVVGWLICILWFLVLIIISVLLVVV